MEDFLNILNLCGWQCLWTEGMVSLGAGQSLTLRDVPLLRRGHGCWDMAEGSLGLPHCALS